MGLALIMQCGPAHAVGPVITKWLSVGGSRELPLAVQDPLALLPGRLR